MFRTAFKPTIWRNDQLVEYRKPQKKTDWMSDAEFAAAPEWIMLREVKVKVRNNNQSRQVTIMTTLLAYNLVRLVMLRAAQMQKVDLSRISFADALAWIRYNPHKSELCDLRINPLRPGRVEPRRIKKKNSYPTLHKPRQILRQEMVRKRLAA